MGQVFMSALSPDEIVHPRLGLGTLISQTDRWATYRFENPPGMETAKDQQGRKLAQVVPTLTLSRGTEDRGDSDNRETRVSRETIVEHSEKELELAFHTNQG
jgi:hypothetical protein